MDQITHNVRHQNWFGIIKACQERPEGVTARKWLEDNQINEKSYYYWLRKFRKEAYDLMEADTQSACATAAPSQVSFADVSERMMSSGLYNDPCPAAVIQTSGCRIEISNDISQSVDKAAIQKLLLDSCFSF